jgi:nicotinate phosphoribosyltransferase
MYRPDSALLTDLYQLTMLSGYFRQRMDETAVFEMFSRKLPRERNFLLAAGLEQALDWLEGFRFTPEELAWLRARGGFPADFIDYLAQLHFTGDVYAMPEGTVFFPDEPILRVIAPLPQAQVVESRLINLLHLQTVIASKAARCVLVAPDKLLVDFGLRRAHGAEAGLFAARASYIAGFAGTATVLAEQLYAVPSFGTLAHSFIQAHADEGEAFEHFAHAQPNNVVLLVDTYDTEAGARRVVEIAPRLTAAGIRIKGVRLDSGDLAEHARRVRRILDAGGLTDTTIFSSGSLDEYELSALLAAGAPIDGFGIGTRLDTSADAPYLDCAYKLQEYAGLARRKRSEGKATWPGRKQVYRQRGPEGIFERDVLTLEGDRQPGEPLIEKVMENGRRLAPSPDLETLRRRAASQLAQLPAPLRGLAPATPYPVAVAQAVRDLAADVDRHVGLA